MDTDAIIAWMEAHEGPSGYVALGLASLIEYVFPPFPGDTVALVGVFLAATAGWSWTAVYLALNLGSVLGAMSAYAAGRAAARREVRPRWLQTPRVEAALREIEARFEAHGAIVIALNRFVPALRAFFFIAAGLARMNALAVLLWGAVSACAWNALLLLLGFVVGSNWALLARVVGTYSWAAVLLAILAVGAYVWWRARKKRSA